MSSVLCINGGSSSLKFALYRLDDRLADGAFERIGLSDGEFWLRRGDGTALENGNRPMADHAAAVAELFALLERNALPSPQSAGHRVVHGGADHVAPERITPRLLASLRELVPFAPLHLPGEILAMEAIAAHYPGLPQFACFDTAFHRRMPEHAQRFPLPDLLWRQGVRRYGFHGLSYEYIIESFGDKLPARLVIAHLGNGASMAAVRDGQPMDTSMGFTPTGGFMMGTRSGDLDPGILLFLLQQGHDAADLARMLNHESGLLGVSGFSSDMKTLLEARADHAGAARAVDLFCYQLRKQIGAYTAVLGGFDGLVFTGGIGERAADVRREVCDGLDYLGVRIDPERNAVHAEAIHSAASDCAVFVMPTHEDRMIARHVRRLYAA